MAAAEPTSDVWIDLSNSPHVPFFVPIVAELQRRGMTVTFTARDFSQTMALASKSFGEVTLVQGWGRGLAAKVFATVGRAAALVRFARPHRFRLAVSHNSYAQIVAASVLGVPSVTLMDYEHQPANHLAFRLARLVVVPRLFPEPALRRFGARRVHRYPGLKEEVYIGGSGPEEDVRLRLGLDDQVLAVLRPPPDSAAYHRFENPLFALAVDRVLANPNAVGLLLPRTPRQTGWATERWGDRVLKPERAMHGEDLLIAADMMVGAGGTMNREASLLGIPTYSLFAGKLSAVDAHLVDRGLMTLLRTEADLDQLVIEPKPVLSPDRVDPEVNPTLQAIVSSIVEALTTS